MSIVTVTFQNMKARYSVYMKEEDAIAMINNTPMLSGTFEDAKLGISVCLRGEIFKTLGISQPETTKHD